MNRTQLYLAGLLLVQVALILVLRSPFSGAAAGYESRPLLPVLEAITASTFEIQGRDDEMIKLSRADGAWRIEDLGGFPADASKVEELLDDLRELRVRRPVVSSGRYHDSFKVADDEHEARIRLWADEGADPEVDLIVGSSPNFRTSHVRLAGEDAVYEVRGLSSYDVRPATSAWIERQLLEVDEARVVGFTLTNASGSFEIFKEDGIWKVRSPDGSAGASLDQGKVDAFVRAATSVRLDDAVGTIDESGHGFASPAATLVLRFTGDAGGAEGDGGPTETTLTVGGQPADNESRRYVTRDGFGFTGTVWESSVRRLIEDTLDGLQAS